MTDSKVGSGRPVTPITEASTPPASPDRDDDDDDIEAGSNLHIQPSPTKARLRDDLGRFASDKSPGGAGAGAVAEKKKLFARADETVPTGDPSFPISQSKKGTGAPAIPTNGTDTGSGVGAPAPAPAESAAPRLGDTPDHGQGAQELPPVPDSPTLKRRGRPASPVKSPVTATDMGDLDTDQQKRLAREAAAALTRRFDEFDPTPGMSPMWKLIALALTVLVLLGLVSSNEAAYRLEVRKDAKARVNAAFDSLGCPPAFFKIGVWPKKPSPEYHEMADNELEHQLAWSAIHSMCMHRDNKTVHFLVWDRQTLAKAVPVFDLSPSIKRFACYKLAYYTVNLPSNDMPDRLGDLYDTIGYCNESTPLQQQRASWHHKVANLVSTTQILPHIVDTLGGLTF